jgi:DMSO/TMAO reductase YedYZ heme-binding membrane subunit
MSRRTSAGRRAAYSVAEVNLGAAAGRRKRRYAGSLISAGVILSGAFAAGATRTGSTIIFAIQGFLAFYVDVFALVALTATVAAGLIATDRIIMKPGHRIVAQAIHRALALLAMAFLGTHIVLEVLEGNARVVDAVVPFLDPHKTFYVGLGTIASDLLVVIAATGIMRRRFTGERRPLLWRAVHWTSYAAWPMGIVHSLLAGRQAKPYVDWSYGACMIVVGVALVVRAAAEVRPREVRSHSPADGAGLYLQAVAQAAVQARLSGQGNWQNPGTGRLPGTSVPQLPPGRLPAGGPAPPASPAVGFPSVDPRTAGFPSVGPRTEGFASGAPPSEGFPPPMSPPVGFPSVGREGEGFPPPSSPPVGFPSVRRPGEGLPPPPTSPPVGFPSVGDRAGLPDADTGPRDPADPENPWSGSWARTAPRHRRRGDRR